MTSRQHARLILCSSKGPSSQISNFENTRKYSDEKFFMPRAAPSQKVQSARLKKLTFGGVYAAKPGFTESRHRHTCGLIWPLKWHLLQTDYKY